MRLTQRGVLPPVNFAELDASLQSSILAPAGAKLVVQTDLGATLASSILGPSGARIVAGADFTPTLTDGSNGAVVTLVAAGQTTVVSLGSIAFTLGQLVFFLGQMNATKGGTFGTTLCSVFFQAGTGQVIWRTGQNLIEVFANAVPANNVSQQVVSGFARCNVAGTVTPILQGQSIGSDSSVSIGAGQFAIWVV